MLQAGTSSSRLTDRISAGDKMPAQSRVAVRACSTMYLWVGLSGFPIREVSRTNRSAGNWHRLGRVLGTIQYPETHAGPSLPNRVLSVIGTLARPSRSCTTADAPCPVLAHRPR